MTLHMTLHSEPQNQDSRATGFVGASRASGAGRSTPVDDETTVIRPAAMGDRSRARIATSGARPDDETTVMRCVRRGHSTLNLA